MIKTCRSCGETKPLDDFIWIPPSRGRVGYWRGNCRRCHYDVRNAYRRSKRQSDLPWAQRHRDYNRDQRRCWKYGLSEAEYQALLALHDGLCGVCGRPEPVEGKRLAVDHDHVTGRVRGLLCSHCNRGIGMFGDDPERLRAAADYIERHRAALEGIHR